MPPKFPKAYVFDMDGVLVDSSRAHQWAYEQLFAPYGISYTMRDFRTRALGKARAQVIADTLGKVDDKEFQGLMARKVELVERYLRQHTLETLPGVTHLLEQLRAQGFPMAVATTSRTPNLFLDAAGLTHHFDAIIDSTHVDRSKPAPDLYLAAAKALSVAPQDCVAVEDSVRGIRSALRAGMTVFGMPTGLSAEQLSEAHGICRTLPELPALVEALGPCANPASRHQKMSSLQQ